MVKSYHISYLDNSFKEDDYPRARLIPKDYTLLVHSFTNGLLKDDRFGQQNINDACDDIIEPYRDKNAKWSRRPSLSQEIPKISRD